MRGIWLGKIILKVSQEEGSDNGEKKKKVGNIGLYEECATFELLQ